MKAETLLGMCGLNFFEPGICILWHHLLRRTLVRMWKKIPQNIRRRIALYCSLFFADFYSTAQECDATGNDRSNTIGYTLNRKPSDKEGFLQIASNQQKKLKYIITETYVVKTTNIRITKCITVIIIK